MTLLFIFHFLFICLKHPQSKYKAAAQKVTLKWLWPWRISFIPSTCPPLRWLNHLILSSTWSPPSSFFYSTLTLIACSLGVSHSSTTGLSRGTGRGLTSHIALPPSLLNLNMEPDCICLSAQWKHCDPPTQCLFSVHRVLTLEVTPQLDHVYAEWLSWLIWLVQERE